METLLNPLLPARAYPITAPALDLEAFLEQGALLGVGSDAVWVGWGEPAWTAEPIRGRASLYAPDFFLEAQRPWLTYPRQRQLAREELAGLLKAEHADEIFPELSALEWSPPDATAFQAAFEDLQREFAAGRLRKAVPVVFEGARARVDAERKRRWLSALLRNSAGLPVQPYGFWTAREGMLGASPESLFELHATPDGAARLLRTMALAGTRPIPDADRLPLLEDPKELREHRIVVDGIREAIREAGWGEVRAGEVRELKLPTLSHLQTPLEVELARPVAFEAVARVLHPTPALGAFPRAEGMRWLAHQRELAGSVARRRFGAPFGVEGPAGVSSFPSSSSSSSLSSSWSSSTSTTAPASTRLTVSSRCWVAIRNLQWGTGDLEAPAGGAPGSRSSRALNPHAAGEPGRGGEQDVFLGAGCGIVPESELSREWGELALKIRSVKRFFDL